MPLHCGAKWESSAYGQVPIAHSEWGGCSFQTRRRAELDLLLLTHRHPRGFEFMGMEVPRTTKSTRRAAKALGSTARGPSHPEARSTDRITRSPLFRRPKSGNCCWTWRAEPRHARAAARDRTCRGHRRWEGLVATNLSSHAGQRNLLQGTRSSDPGSSTAPLSVPLAARPRSALTFDRNPGGSAEACGSVWRHVPCPMRRSDPNPTTPRRRRGAP